MTKVEAPRDLVDRMILAGVLPASSRWAAHAAVLEAHQQIRATLLETAQPHSDEANRLEFARNQDGDPQYDDGYHTGALEALRYFAADHFGNTNA